MTAAQPTLRYSTDNAPAAVQRTHSRMAARIRELVRVHEAEFAPNYYRAFARAAFAAYVDAKAPVETTPIEDVVEEAEAALSAGRRRIRAVAR